MIAPAPRSATGSLARAACVLSSVISCIVLCAACPSSAANGKALRPGASSLSSADGPPLRHLELLEQFALTYRFRLGRPSSVRLTPDGKHALYVRSGPRSFEHKLYELDVKSGRERVLATVATLLGKQPVKISAEDMARRERMRKTARGISSFRLSRDGARVLIPIAGRLFLLARENGVARELPRVRGYAIDARFSPDGKMVACVRDGALYVIDIAKNIQRRVTPASTPTRRYGVAEFVAQEEMQRFRGYWWSPDSRRIAFAEVDVSRVETLYVSAPAKPASKPRPFRYPRAGKANASVRLGVVWLSSGATRWIARDAAAWPYIATVRWRDGPLLVVLQDRRQRRVRVQALDDRVNAHVLVDEQVSAGWIDIDQSVPRWVNVASRNARVASSARALLWSAERGDRRVLELRDGAGRLLRQIVGPAQGYRRLVGVDAIAGRVYFEGGVSPAEGHVFSAALSGGAGAAIKLTRTRGHHRGKLATHAKRRGDVALWVDVFAGPAGARRVTLRGANPARASRVVREIPSVAEPLPFKPRIERMTVGARRFNALVVRPRDIDKTKRYPVIVYVYGGPRHLVVREVADRYAIQQWLADQGFIIVMLDGRGTPHRGRAWEQAIYKSFVRVPLGDQVEGIHALAKRLPQADFTRAGIFGWSFGGYLSAMAALLRPDVFKAAVAGAPVTTWRDYDTHYTERYLGLPSQNAVGYGESSAIAQAAKLRRPLLLVHGTTDDNVYFSHTLKLSRALFLAGKHHEVLALSGLTHMVSVADVTKRLYGRIARFFLRHLGAPVARGRSD